MTPKQARALQTLREVEAGIRALRRHANVEYLERLSKRRLVKVEHSMHDHVTIHVLEKGHPPLTTHQPDLPERKVLVTLVESGAEFPSEKLITQLRLVLE